MRFALSRTQILRGVSMGNSNLHNAKIKKNDEFYTMLSDIENELKHYKEHFKDKVVFCNCDDPEWSNFFKYFDMNFNHLGLKKLITTSVDSLNQHVPHTILLFSILFPSFKINTPCVFNNHSQLL